MADERERLIRGLVTAAERHWKSNGFGLSNEGYAQWIKDGSAAHALHRDGAQHLTYLLDALDAAREREKRLREEYYEFASMTWREGAFEFMGGVAPATDFPLAYELIKEARAALAGDGPSDDDD